VSRKKRKPQDGQHSARPTSSTEPDRWFAVVGLALLAVRWFIPAESTDLGETLWLVPIWLLLTAAWFARGAFRGWTWTRLHWDLADLAVWLIVAGHLCSTGIVLLTGGHQRAAVNLAWEWVGVGIAFTMLRQWLPGGGASRRLLSLIIVVAVALSGLGLWQHFVWYPANRSLLEEYNALAAQADRTPQERARMGELADVLGSVALEPDPTARWVVQQRVLASTEPIGRFALANSLGGLLAVAFVLMLGACTARIGAEVSGVRTGVLWLVTTLVGSCLLLTKSRSAWIGSLAGLALWALLRRGAKRFSRAHGIALGAAAAVLIGLIALAARTGGLDRLVITEAPKSVRYRIEYWTTSLNVIFEDPMTTVFGAGPGNFRQRYLKHKLPESSEEVLDPHNQFLDAWTNGGLAALAGLCLVWIGFARRCGRLADDDAQQIPAPDTVRTDVVAALAVAGGLMFLAGQLLPLATLDAQFLLLLGVGAATVVLLPDLQINRRIAASAGFALGVHLLAAGGFGMPAFSAPLFLLLLPEPKTGASSTATDQPRSPWISMAPGLVCVALACAALVTAAVPAMISTAYVAAGDVSLRQLDLQTSRRLFEDAAEIDRLDPEPWQHLAQLDVLEAERNPTAADRSLISAVAHLQESIKRDPYSPKRHFSLGELLRRQYHKTRDSAVLEQAIEAMQSGVDGYPHEARMRATLAQTLSEAGRSQQAAEQARIALELDDLNVERAHYDRVLENELRDALSELAAEGE